VLRQKKKFAGGETAMKKGVECLLSLECRNIKIRVAETTARWVKGTIVRTKISWKEGGGQGSKGKNMKPKTE